MISVIIPTWKPELAQEAIEACRRTQGGEVLYNLSGTPDTTNVKLGVLKSMAIADGIATHASLRMYMHDDVEIQQQGWDAYVEAFAREHPRAGLFGFGGATGLANLDIYKRPYKLQQLARHNFYSNMKDHHIHGFHATEPMRVAVLDGFVQIFTREAYERMGGWQAAIDDGMPPFHCYDLWAACMMRRLGYEVWMLPIKCWHKGGLTSTTKEYDTWLREHGWDGDIAVHQKAHEVLYNLFRDVLPIRVTQ